MTEATLPNEPVDATVSELLLALTPASPPWILDVQLGMWWVTDRLAVRILAAASLLFAAWIRRPGGDNGFRLGGHLPPDPRRLTCGECSGRRVVRHSSLPGELDGADMNRTP